MERYKTLILIMLMFFQVQGQSEDNCLHIEDLKEDSKQEVLIVPCEPNWYYFEGKCYKMPRNKTGPIELNWKDAAKKCLEYGAHLVTIKHPRVQKFVVMNFVMDVKKDVWIGLHKTSAWPREFEWHDDSSVGYTNWGSYQPSKTYNGKNEDCVDIMYSRYNIDGKWNDVHCTDYIMPFVCQKNQDPKFRSPNPRYCPEDLGGGIKFRDSCFNFVKEEKSWEEAEDYCIKHYNGHLAAIYDNPIKYNIANLLDERNSADYWIGIHFQDVTYQKWSSGRYVDLVLSQELQNSWNDDYVLLDYKLTDICSYFSGKNVLQIDTCKKSKYFICEVPLNKEFLNPSQFKVSTSECPGNFKDWVDLGGDKCYYFSMHIADSWHKANFECMQRGGALASIHSQAESDALQSFYSYDEPNLHIGLLRNTNGDEFIWADGSEVDYESWMSGEPNDRFEKCVELRTGSMEWNDIPCSASKKYICSVKKIPRTSKNSILGIYKQLTSQYNKQATLGLHSQLKETINAALSKQQGQKSSTGGKDDLPKKEFNSKEENNEVIIKEFNSEGAKDELLNKEPNLKREKDEVLNKELNSKEEKNDLLNKESNSIEEKNSSPEKEINSVGKNDEPYFKELDSKEFSKVNAWNQYEMLPFVVI